MSAQVLGHEGLVDGSSNSPDNHEDVFEKIFVPELEAKVEGGGRNMIKDANFGNDDREIAPIEVSVLLCPLKYTKSN